MWVSLWRLQTQALSFLGTFCGTRKLGNRQEGFWETVQEEWCCERVSILAGAGRPGALRRLVCPTWAALGWPKGRSPGHWEEEERGWAAGMPPEALGGAKAETPTSLPSPGSRPAAPPGALPKLYPLPPFCSSAVGVKPRAHQLDPAAPVSSLPTAPLVSEKPACRRLRATR